jgi:methylenetetrahydrofolate--tRNA-(uracil-5-)-methyltransferase
LEQARFVRLGMIHRNTFINAPLHLDATLRLHTRPTIRLAGQITGVEGYVESAATGLLAARLLTAEMAGLELSPPPPETALGGLVRHLIGSNPSTFQPANINWGLMSPPPELAEIKDRRDRRLRHAVIAVDSSRRWAQSLET